MALALVACTEDTGLVGVPFGGAAGARSSSGGAGTAGHADAGGASGTSGAPAVGGTGAAGRGAGASGTISGGASGRAGAGNAGKAAGGKAGGASNAGAGGKAGAAAGRAGAAGKEGGSAGMATAGAGDEGGAPSTTNGGCAGRGFKLCEDFESTAVGSVPSGWTKHGSPAVRDDDAHGGSHALKLSAEDFGEQRIYHDPSALGSAHWGRVYYKVQTPVPEEFVHATLVSFMGDGPTNGTSEFRTIGVIEQAKSTKDVGGFHNFIFNVQIEGAGEFGHETNYEYKFDAKWHCAEYHIDAANQSYTFYFDGAEKLSVENGTGNYDDTDIPSEFDELRVGWVNYQATSSAYTVWLDDVAFDDERIGCD